jgi:hypothetical protein
MERMGKFVAWVGKNADGVIALVLAVFIAFLGLTASDRILGQTRWWATTRRVWTSPVAC